MEKLIQYILIIVFPPPDSPRSYWSPYSPKFSLSLENRQANKLAAIKLNIYNKENKRQKHKKTHSFYIFGFAPELICCGILEHCAVISAIKS